MNEDFREVTTSEAKEFADKEEILFIETSAVLNSNVIDAFQVLIEKVYD